MKKETVFKLLAYSCFLLPGSLNGRSLHKRFCYLSPLALFSFLTLIFVIMCPIDELLGYKHFIGDENIKQAIMKLKHVPVRPIGRCIRSLSKNETMIEVEGENGMTVDVVQINSTAAKVSSHDIQHPMSDLEGIVNTAIRLLIFVGNIIIRIFVWFMFPTMITLLVTVFHGEKEEDGGRDPTKAKNRSMCLLWCEAAQRWSNAEKCLLFFILLSLFQREQDLILKFHKSISSTGLDLLVIPCLIVQGVVEQLKQVLARELVTENVAFFVVVLMKTFVNVIGSIANGGDSDESLEEEKDSAVTGSTGFLLNELGRTVGQFGDGVKRSEKQAKAAGDMLFVKTRAILESRAGVVDGGIATIDEHISGIIGGGGKNNGHGGLDGTFQITKQLHSFNRGGCAADGCDASIKTGDLIYSEINFLISTYFDLMGIWEQASRLTGFVTLILFCELTTSFCLNTYITLDNVMTFGLLSGFGLNGVVSGIVILAKFVCVCNAAQELSDMTPILLDRILKLKLQLLSLPVEHFRKSDKMSGDTHFSTASPLDNFARSPGTSQCERCRGLGSFLSEMVSYIRAHPFELSALGYFTVSRSTLTTITGVIVTYLVVLVQFQSYASSK